MTTTSDLEFRMQYFRDRAKDTRRRASQLEDEAAEFDAQADKIEQILEFQRS